LTFENCTPCINAALKEQDPGASCGQLESRK
jgi:hypothetical protein